MFDLTTSHYIQLILGLAFGLLLFAAAYAMPKKWTVFALLLLVPFQPISSVYGTLNIVLIYFVAVAFFFRGEIKRLPLLGFVLFILASYLVSLVFAPSYSRLDNITYIIAIGANFLMFYLVFNYVSSTKDLAGFMRMLISLNVLVALYCLLQMLVGLDQLKLFGIQEFSIQQNRISSFDPRLKGPFNAVGITAEFLVIQLALLAYFLITEKSKKWRLIAIALIPANFAFLIATGNRTGLIVLLGGALLYAVLFRRELGVKRLIVGGVLGLLMFAIMAVVITSYSQFDRLFVRLEATQGATEARSALWPYTLEKVAEKPIFGHGPRLRLTNEGARVFPAGYEFAPYPHNLYLFLAYTLGLTGLVAYVMFFLRLLYLFNQGRRRHSALVTTYIARLAVVVWAVIMVDQIKVSAMRGNLSDYQQYLFMLFGFLLAGAMMKSQITDARKSGKTQRLLKTTSSTFTTK